MERVGPQEENYRDQTDRDREAGLRWQVQDLSSALVRVQLKLEETNVHCEQLALRARDISSVVPKESASDCSDDVEGRIKLLLDQSNMNDGGTDQKRSSQSVVQGAGESSDAHSDMRRIRHLESALDEVTARQLGDAYAYCFAVAENERLKLRVSFLEVDIASRTKDILSVGAVTMIEDDVESAAITVERSEMATIVQAVEDAVGDSHVSRIGGDGGGNDDDDDDDDDDDGDDDGAKINDGAPCRSNEIEVMLSSAWKRDTDQESKDIQEELEQLQKDKIELESLENTTGNDRRIAQDIERAEGERKVNKKGNEGQIEVNDREKEEKLERDDVAELTLCLAEYKKKEILWLLERTSWQEERAERVSEQRQWQGLQNSWEEDSAMERWKLSVLAEEIKSKWDEVLAVIPLLYSNPCSLKKGDEIRQDEMR